MKSGGVILKDGVIYYPDYLSLEEQLGLLQATREIVAQAPLFQPRMPRTNTPFSVKMTNCGVLGWVSDVKGYRYQETHPDTEKPWPAMPDRLLETWQALSNYHAPPEACLINFYDQAAKMGLHQDRDEADFDAPVISLSLGDSAIFRIGGTTRKGATQSVKLHSGDALMFGGAARLAFHGIDRILTGTSTLLENGGRLNFTMRRVTKV
jgi:alkylated DNA repair protein (DNA oxidative demethylase)